MSMDDPERLIPCTKQDTGRFTQIACASVMTGHQLFESRFAERQGCDSIDDENSAHKDSHRVMGSLAYLIKTEIWGGGGRKSPLFWGFLQECRKIYAKL